LYHKKLRCSIALAVLDILFSLYLDFRRVQLTLSKLDRHI
jgi:hypothetical protein